MDTMQMVVNNLENMLGDKGRVVTGWVTKVKDFSHPVISVTTYNHWPNHADINIWSESITTRDIITKMVLQALNLMSEQLSIENVMPITFEEEGILQPGSWKTIKNSNRVFRQLIQISY